jgi:hypothetical protein
MSTKKAFSRSDVAAITTRMSHKPAYGVASATLSHAPASPVAAKVMREVGVSREKMSKAYSFAKTTIIAKK